MDVNLIPRNPRTFHVSACMAGVAYDVENAESRESLLWTEKKKRKKEWTG